MLDDNRKVWPIPKFNFTLTIPGLDYNASFQEVSGLEQEISQDQIRKEAENVFHLPSSNRNTQQSITLRRGIFPSFSDYDRWYNALSKSHENRHTAILSLNDENGNTTMSWTLFNIWPRKITFQELQSTGNEIAIETLELTFEGMEISN